MFEFLDFFTVKVPASPSPPSVPVRQWSFDNLDGLVLMEGTVQVTFNALTTGKVVNQYLFQEWPKLVHSNHLNVDASFHIKGQLQSNIIQSNLPELKTPFQYVW